MEDYNHNRYSQLSHSYRKDIDFSSYEFDEKLTSKMKNWETYGLIRKDIQLNDNLTVLDILDVKNKKYIAYYTNLDFYVYADKKKENQFFNFYDLNYNLDDILENTFIKRQFLDWLKENQMYVKVYGKQQNFYLASLIHYHYEKLFEEFKQQIQTSKNKKKNFDYDYEIEDKYLINETEKSEDSSVVQYTKNKDIKIYNAKIIAKNSGGFLATIKGVTVFLPGSLAAANKIIDFDSYLNKEIPVMIENYTSQNNFFIVSNKKYLDYVLPYKVEELKQNLQKEYTGNITGFSDFGIFIEFDCYFTGFLHLTEMNRETKYNFINNKYQPNDEIKVRIKEIESPRKIILTQLDLTSDEIITLSQIKEKYLNSYVKGEVFKITNYGYFIYFSIEQTNFLGLLSKEYLKKIKYKDNLKLKQKLFLKISYVDCENKKIFLTF